MYGRHRKSVTEEVDRQRLISTIAFRAIADNVTLRTNLPKSRSSITLLSELYPLTQNALYQESIYNPVTRTKAHMLGTFWEIRSSSSTNPGNQKLTWTLLCCIHEGNIYGALQEQALWDSSEWEEQELKVELKEKFDADTETPSGCSTKLSGREQARQFEQHA